MKENSSQLIFIIGIGRSGTTLLQSILNAHSQIHFNKETHFVKNYIVKELSNKKYSKNSIDQLVQDIKKDPLLVDYTENIELAKSAVLNSDSVFTTPLFFKTILQNKKSIYLGEKDPMNVNYLKQIKIAFPNSKVIHIVRDPRDVVLSRLKSGWSKRKSVIWHSAEYGFSIKKVRQEGKLFFENEFFEIKYEDLLKDRSFYTKELCDFLRVNFEENMYFPEESASELIRPDELQWKSNVLKPVDISNTNKWKSELSNIQKRIINLILEEEINFLGYEQIKNRVFFLTKIYYSLAAKFIKMAFKIRYK